MGQSADTIAARFSIPKNDQALVDLILSIQARDRLKWTACAVVGVAAMVWILAALLGWIFHGFRGMTRGQDFS
jgi:hypothetical protein